MSVTVDGLRVADPVDAWTRAGFDVGADDVCRVGGVRIRLVGGQGGAGIVGWSLGGVAALDEVDEVDGVDGIPTEVSGLDSGRAPAAHPNGVTAIDHVVLMSPNLGRTVAALATVGVEPRRQRDAELGGRPVRQVFFRMGEVILEVVGTPEAVGDGPSTLWGITYVVADIEATAAYFGDHAAPVKDAVQPGRRITTIRHRDLGMSVPTAMISAAYPRRP
ncbi:glyoxalase [Mycolicibacterium vaccae]|uniref:glyoxalase n=1 Tax=Mycolicibacterium vaccae TaxID=1810 RepID=UPI003D06CCD3